MRFNSAKSRFALRKKKYGDWHLWFAWFPVMLNDESTVWLETVNRRFVADYDWGPHRIPWAYRSIDDDLPQPSTVETPKVLVKPVAQVPIVDEWEEF